MSATSDHTEASIVAEDFDLAPKEKPITINGATYVVKEATANVGKNYRNMLTNNITLVDGKPTSVGNLADVEPYLAAACLFKRTVSDKDGSVVDHPVALQTVLAWPDRVQKRIAEIAKELSGFEDGTDPKKSQSGGEGSSTPPESSESSSTS